MSRDASAGVLCIASLFVASGIGAAVEPYALGVALGPIVAFGVLLFGGLALGFGKKN